MERGYHAIAGLITCLVGLIVIITVKQDVGRYVALCILLAGSYITPSLTMAWLSGNTPGELNTYDPSLGILLLTFLQLLANAPWSLVSTGSEIWPVSLEPSSSAHSMALHTLFRSTRHLVL